MAFGSTRGTLTGGNNSIPASFPTTAGSIAVSVGDLLIAVVGQQTNLTVTAMADNLGNTWSAQNAGTDAGTVTGRMFYSRVTNAGTLTTVTATCSGSTNDGSIVAAAIEGPFRATPLDATPANVSNDTTTPYTGPASGTLSQADEYVVSWFAKDGSSAWTASSPNASVVQQGQSANIATGIGGYVVSATTTQSPAWTGTAPSADVIGTASFRLDTGIAVGSATATGAASGVGTGVVDEPGSAAGVGAANASGPTQWDIVKKSTTISLSNVNLTFTGSTTGGRSLQVNAPFTRNTYFEVLCNTATASVSIDVGICKTIANFEDYLNGPGIGMLLTTSGVWQIWDNNAQVSGANGNVAATTNHTVRVAYDPTNNKVYFGIDGNWVVGDPAAGTGGLTPAGGAGTYFAGAGTETAAASGTANFGNTAFAYAPPVGYAGFEQIGSVGSASGVSTANAQGASNVNIGNAPGTSTANAVATTRWDASHTYANIAISNNGKTITHTGGSGDKGSSQGSKKLVGKVYYELTWTSISGQQANLGLVPDMVSSFFDAITNQSYAGFALVDQVFTNDNYRVMNSSTQVLGNQAISAASHTVGIAYDQPNNKVYLSVDGTWKIGDPSAGTGGLTPLAGAVDLFVGGTVSNTLGTGGNSITAEFQHPVFAVPTGYVPLDQPDQTGIGAATGVGAASAVGLSLSAAVGSAAGVGAASAVGNANFVGVGNATGSGSTTGVGNANFDGVGSSSGVGAASGAGSGGSSIKLIVTWAEIEAIRAPSGTSIGSAAGVGAASAVGAALFAAVGSAAGIGAASATSNANFAAVGAAVGVGAATAIGRSDAASVGSSTSVGAAAAIGASNAASAGNATGLGAASAVGASFGAGVGSATGSGAASAVGASTAASVGSSDGVGAASAVGAALGIGVGNAAGVGAANASSSAGASNGAAAGIGDAVGVGASTAASVGSATGTGAATGVGAALGAGVGSATGTGAASGVGNANFAGVGNAAGTSTANAISVSGAFGTAAGVGTASAVGASTAASVGSATSIGVASATGNANFSGVGNSSGVGAASAVGKALFNGVGNATGVGTASGVAPFMSVGSAAGTGVASAVGSSIGRGAGSSSGTGVALASGIGGGVGAGSASGTGTASAQTTIAFVGAGSASGVGTAIGVGLQIGTSSRRKTNPISVLNARTSSVDPRKQDLGDSEVRKVDTGSGDPRKKNFGQRR